MKESVQLTFEDLIEYVKSPLFSQRVAAWKKKFNSVFLPGGRHYKAFVREVTSLSVEEIGNEFLLILEKRSKLPRVKREFIKNSVFGIAGEDLTNMLEAKAQMNEEEKTDKP